MYNQSKHVYMAPRIAGKSDVLHPGFKKIRVFKKSPAQWVFWGFLDKQEKIGKIIQKLSNLKP